MRDIRPLARDLLSGLSLLTHPFRAALCRVFRRASRPCIPPPRAYVIHALDLAARRRALLAEMQADSMRRRESAPIEIVAFGDRLTTAPGKSSDFGCPDAGSTPSRTGD